MAKKFYTERDIEDMAARGEHTLTVDEDVVLTELAFEKAEKLGVKLAQPHQTPPSAPVRPYLAEEQPTSDQAVSEPPATSDQDLRQRIRTAVKTKLGEPIDDALLDNIITRVLNNIEVK